MSISIIGAGRVGLVSGACLADLGNQVLCMDRDEARITALQSGETPFFEPGLEDLLRRNRERLRFTTDFQEALDQSLALWVCVATPLGGDGTADLSQVLEVARRFGAALREYKVLVIRSTVPSGSAGVIRTAIEEARTEDVPFDLVISPDFTREGRGIDDFMKPSRIVIGSETPQALAIVQDVFQPLISQGAPLLATSPATAEIIKYASNAFLATKLSFLNEVADLCEQVGADVVGVAEGMGLDRRIGDQYLQAGPGFGGPRHFPKDSLAFVSLGRDHARPLGIVEAAISANQHRHQRSLERILALLPEVPEVPEGARVGVLGASYKADSDEVELAPALPLLAALQEQGIQVQLFDPRAGEAFAQSVPGLVATRDEGSALQDTDLALVFTDWNQFRALDWGELGSRMRTRKVLDFRNLYQPQRMADQGFEYHCLGRPYRQPESSPV